VREVRADMVFLGDTVIQVGFGVMPIAYGVLTLPRTGLGEKRHDAQTGIEGP
jgi:hypothetical protein